MNHLKTLERWHHAFENLHTQGIRWGIDEVKHIAGQLKLQQFPVPVITVGGTNGKGSCVRALEAAYLAAGYKVAATCSPHILNLTERLRLNGDSVDEAVFLNALILVQEKAQDRPLSYFEVVTLASLLCIQDYKPDVILLEVGLGGTLDAMNVVDNDVALITSIGFDHIQWLGNTLEDIASAKAGIIKSMTRFAVVGPTVCQGVVKRTADAENALLVEAAPTFKHARLPQVSCDCAWAVLKALSDRLPFEEASARSAIERATLLGRDMRYTVPSTGVEVRMDIAHNPDACGLLATRLPAANKTVFLFSAFSDKDISEMVQPLLGKGKHWVLCPNLEPRSATSDELAAILAPHNEAYSTAPDPIKGLDAAMQHCARGDYLVIFGGFAVISCLLPTILEKVSEGEIIECTRS